MVKPPAEYSPRYAAIATLLQLEQTRLPVSQIFDRIAFDCGLKPADRQLAMKICYGVLRQRHYLDHLLSLLCHRPLKKLKPFVYQALCTGLYQLFFLDRVPPSAVVNETVKALRAAHLPQQLQGFVNGLLRASLRRRSKLPLPDAPDSGLDRFLNHPDWLTQRWRLNYGEAAMRRICSSNNREPSLTLRVSHRSTAADFITLLEQSEIAAEQGAFAPDSVIVKGYHGPVSGLPGYRRGLFQVQDQASQLVTLLLGPFAAGLSYLDACAGVGGKILHLSSLLSTVPAYLTAIEPAPERFRQLRENLLRLSDPEQVRASNQTLERFSRSCKTRFDAILVDAPCSGTGIIGRQPDIRWNRREQDLAVYQGRQFKLLEQAAELLIPGGVLVYGVCSIEPEEGRGIVERFLNARPGFTLDDPRPLLPQPAHTLVRSGCFAPLPDEGIDGFFAARMIHGTGSASDGTTAA